MDSLLTEEMKITVYTTRPDTLYGATFMVACLNMRWRHLATDETREAVEKYIYDASMKSNVDRLQDKERQAYLQALMQSIRLAEQNTDLAV